MSAPRPPPPSAPPPSPLNINIGILGHVDSGKTSLSKILSSTFSTASLDRSRESKERGITLDLGFSSFTVPTTRLAPPLHDHIIKALPTPAPPDLQYTIVDHPGHSTLLRTIILGHHIIDTSILVIDSIGGVQPQTVEACVLGDIILANNESKGLIIVNKIDLLVEGTEGPRYQNLLTSIAELTKGEWRAMSREPGERTARARRGEETVRDKRTNCARNAHKLRSKRSQTAHFTTTNGAAHPCVLNRPFRATCLVLFSNPRKLPPIMQRRLRSHHMHGMLFSHPSPRLPLCSHMCMA